MEIDTLMGAFRDFEKKGEKETCPILDQFLSHVAKTGETMIQWSQIKGYFLFKLEKVMDDFKDSCPEQRGPANPNVEYIPFEEMKQRILKIVNGYNGIPFTIQRLCELLTEPKRNYAGTDKFLRGVEKNVMVVSCVYPTSEKKGSGCVNRMNGVMFPGNTSAFPDRNVNGPGTHRPLNRPKLSLSSSVATNGLPDSTESKEQASEQSDRTVNKPSASEAEGSHGGPVKCKHHEDDNATNTETREAKRLKFEEEEDDNEEGMEKELDEKQSPCTSVAESSSDVPQSSTDTVTAEVKDTKPDKFVTEDQEPSSTQSEVVENRVDKSTSDDSPDPSHNQATGSESDLPEQWSEREESAKAQETDERNDPVSSSSCSSNNSSDEGVSSAETPSACSSSSTELTAEGSTTAEISSDSSETADDTMEQD
ncbi:serine/threonine-protein phosphatase 4 regulatory subunit 2-A-like [Sinocyclocheilus rhinocerous]|uniref:Serine/threonine-protein phosphatase 4 regulatory subunit 2-A-like n=1 Tax=Sinocyclocheilus rhinocerous TaxID=307959 RepID=A0A673L9B7_9TELE|nr:PREDICTED: serine/threonine-protein phosphatase 4 regulatory subunit 2-A-like [Sinocyclocheilus rhinocerous]